jgi:hypothetical protein
MVVIDRNPGKQESGYPATRDSGSRTACNPLYSRQEASVNVVG